MIKMKFTYMIYSMYENDDENLHDEVTYEYEGRNLNEILEMAVDDEIDFADKIKVSNGHKKSWFEVCRWTMKVEKVVFDQGPWEATLMNDDKEQQEIKESLKFGHIMRNDKNWIICNEI